LSVRSVPLRCRLASRRAGRAGQKVEIGWFDRRILAVVAQEPLYDPKMERLRG
jgi:hypothetical protein